MKLYNGQGRGCGGGASGAIRPWSERLSSLPVPDLHLEGVKRYVQVVEELQDQQPGISFSHKE